MPIDTRKAPRRTLAFASIPDLRAELDALEHAHLAGTLRTSGNWTPAQIFNHLAAWIDFAYEGFPPELRVPWLLRFIVSFFRKRVLSSPFPLGVSIPGAPDGTFGQIDSSFELAIDNLRLALERLELQHPTHPSPLFGFLSHAQWIQLHLRHAELHLGFLHPSP
jgi:hypothetical protein